MGIYKEMVVSFFQILLYMRWEMDPKSGWHDFPRVIQSKDFL
jgi:hypothetical protein